MAKILFTSTLMICFIGGCGINPSHQNEKATSQQNENSTAQPDGEAGKQLTAHEIGMEFKTLPAGIFTMGKGDNTHQVTLTKSFEMGVHEVTQLQYERVMGKNPSQFEDDDKPVETVSWNDAVEFCRKLSELPAEKAAGSFYRLPTEAEWEYACRAGTTTKFSFGDDDSEFSDYGWYGENSFKMTHPVGEKKPNGWGLYDMHGNVWEWCYDFYEEETSIDPVADPTGPESGSYRVSRGGSWYLAVGFSQSAFTRGLPPTYRFNDIGFRVVRVPSSKAIKNGAKP